MRLVYCIPSLDTMGGTERVLTDKVNYLTEKFGHEIIIVLTETQHAAPFFPLHPSVRVIGLNLNFRELNSRNLVLKSLGYMKKVREYRRRLEQLLIELKPDVTTSLLAWEVDFLGHLRDGSRKVGECHFNKDFRYSFIASASRTSWLRKKVAQLRNRQLIGAVQRLDHLVVLTHRAAAAWSEMPHKTVIPNALSVYPDFSSGCDTQHIIAVGRYMPEKGYDLLLQAWAVLEHTHPEWSLSIYGDGECRAALQEYIALRGLTRVALEHSVKDVFAEFAKGGFSVLSSRFEGFGMVVIEAMACGLPVVAFDCDSGPAEIIRDGDDGLLVRPENVAELTEKMSVLMTDHALRKQMGQAAKKHSIRFKLEFIMPLWSDLYQRLADERV